MERCRADNYVDDPNLSPSHDFRWFLLFPLRTVLSCCYGSPRKGRYGEGGAKTSTATVFARSAKEPQSSCAPASGSTFSSGRMAPRMKLVRKASRDLSADVQVRNSPQFGYSRNNSGSNWNETDYNALIGAFAQEKSDGNIDTEMFCCETANSHC